MKALFIAPQQARSRRSVSRILDAVEVLLADQNFDDLAVSDIAAKAGVSVGNFYSRFKTKDALLSVLFERYEQERYDQLSQSMEGLIDANLHDCLCGIIIAIVDLFRARRGVLKSLILVLWRRPEQISDLTEERIIDLIEQISTLLLSKRHQIRHHNPARAIKMALSTILSSCRETIVLRPPELPGNPQLLDHEFALELAEMTFAYLTTDQSKETYLQLQEI